MLTAAHLLAHNIGIQPVERGGIAAAQVRLYAHPTRLVRAKCAAAPRPRASGASRWPPWRGDTHS